MEEIDLADIHRHIFKIAHGGRFVAYEYIEGKVSDLSDISIHFFKDLVEYLQSHQLGDTVDSKFLANPLAIWQNILD